MTHKEYNGWFNYETWLVKLWMDNEEGTYRFFQEQAEQVLRDDPDDEDNDRIRTLAAIIQEAHEESLPKLEGFAADLMNAALSEVNWEEIAGSLLEDAKEALA
jgi:hypothetical protein